MQQEDQTIEPDAAAADDRALQELSDWIVEQGLRGSDNLASLIEEFCVRMCGIGVKLLRMHISIAALHPTIVGYGGQWWRGHGFRLENYERESQLMSDFQNSPLRVLRNERMPEMRRRLDGDDVDLGYPVFEEFREVGGTEWIGRLVEFGTDGEETALPGMLISWLTDRPGGFLDREVALMNRILPRLALVCYRIALKRVAKDLLDAYVGVEAGRRVLSGQILRGDATQLYAVVMIADLREFTRFAEETPSEDVLASLNRVLGDLTDAVEAQGGEVLKFLGDGVLAIFSLENQDPGAVAAGALAAAQSALSANVAYNRERSAAGLPPLKVDIALDLGELMYGNVGSNRRLDFTVIGPAVNEASRIEALCEPLGHHLLMSKSFADAFPGPLTSIGEHWLRGVARPQALFVASEAA
ncbi:adenylate/guanylate cyclase domain-containing protein [Amorphus sp. 3PC139-8]|uniref:adenylate/guanylate cyclase domain-containing protein n=1 Tax=Amorphus sp. 3PC139-8 TaxID=2735676 RepID=UPI00345DA46C